MSFDINNDEEYTNIKVRLIQPNITQEEKWDDNLKDNHFDKLVRMSSVNNDAFKPKYIIWPESAFQFDNEILKNKNFNLFSWLDNDQLLITGATDGIGKQTALNIAQAGHSIIIVGRNKEKCERLGLEGYEYVHKQCNSEKMTEQVLNIYEKILK